MTNLLQYAKARQHDMVKQQAQFRERERRDAETKMRDFDNQAKKAFKDYYRMGDIRPVCGDYLHNVAMVRQSDPNSKPPAGGEESKESQPDK